MQVKWLAEALQDLIEIHRYIANDNSAAAQEVAKRIRATVAYLRENPGMGRPGRVPGTRELVIPSLPYIIPYRVRNNIIEILGVIHGARQWLSESKEE